LAPPDPVGADVGVVVAAAKTSDTAVMQVTALPPPVAVPLHWLTVTGSAVAAPVTVQAAVGSPAYVPPPVTEPLHCVTVALVVLLLGAHASVPPAPVTDPMH
jgi:hypothetical protein